MKKRAPHCMVKTQAISDGGPCAGDPALDQTKPSQARHTAGKKMLVEVICERVHCVMYDYAIATVKLVIEDYGGRIRVTPVVRRGNRKNAERYLELCRMNGRHLSVPTILIDGEIAFTEVPSPDELRQAINEGLAKRKDPQ